MIHFSKTHTSGGYVAIISVVVVMATAMIIVGGTTTSMITKQKQVRNQIHSTQSYYTAEAGIEDSLLRIIDGDLEYQGSNTITIGDTVATTNITQTGNTIEITSLGDAENRVRNLALSLTQDTVGVSFNYGIQIGEGGMEMINNSVVNGNIYSNGDFIGKNACEVIGDVWVANTGTLSNCIVGGEAHAHTIENSEIGGDAYYSTIDSKTTVAGTAYPDSENPELVTMPIDDDQINEWKAAAASGGTLSSYTLENDEVGVLGSKKITGNLVIQNNTTLTITGPIWVEGDVTFQDNAIIVLDPSYGDGSEILISDGLIEFKNNIFICGSEGFDDTEDECYPKTDSYLLAISTVVDGPAISIANNAGLRTAAYAKDGEILIENNAGVVAVTADSMIIKNNAVVNYEQGLVNMSFTGGPSGGWTFGEWREIE